MNRRFIFLFPRCVRGACCRSVRPRRLIYAPGEGWYYEPAGSNAKWTRTRAKDQLEVAEEAFKNQDYSTTLHAAYRVLRVWPLVRLRAPRAISRRPLPRNGAPGRGGVRRLPGSSEEISAQRDNYDEVLWRQYEIANRFYGGQFFRIFWGYLPLYPSMDETAKMYGKIVNNGPLQRSRPACPIADRRRAGKGQGL